MSEVVEVPVVVEGMVIKPGDNVLITLPKDVPMGQALQVQDRLKAKFPGVTFEILVGVSGMAVQHAKN